MSKEYIITMTAANRIGILAAVTNAMAELNAELKEARQTVVRRFFTMIFAAEFADDLDPQIILDHLRDVGRSFGIEVQLNDPDVATLPQLPTGDFEQFLLRVRGRNEPGVLRQIAARVALLDTDIQNLRAYRSDDGAEFEMFIEVAVPNVDHRDKLLATLQELGDELAFSAECEG